MGLSRGWRYLSDDLLSLDSKMFIFSSIFFPYILYERLFFSESFMAERTVEMMMMMMKNRPSELKIIMMMSQREGRKQQQQTKI